VKNKILIIFGTRPEAIKMDPLIKEFLNYSDSFETKICVTAQYREITAINRVIVLYQGGGVSETNEKQIQKEIYDILKTYFPHWIALIRKSIWDFHSFLQP
jgi:UDP-N-acetylglucosamine 2-epimerase